MVNCSVQGVRTLLSSSGPGHSPSQRVSDHTKLKLNQNELAVFSSFRKISLLTLTSQIIFGPMAGTERHCIVLALIGKKECTRVQPVRPFGQTHNNLAHQFVRHNSWSYSGSILLQGRSSTTNTELRCYQLWNHF